MIELDKLLVIGKKMNFAAIGALKARQFDELLPELQKRADENRKTLFEEQQLDLRTNPFLLMDSAKSIIVTATSYYNDSSLYIKDKPRFAGKLARFARGLDYHQVVHRQLNNLAKRIQELEPELFWRAFVDTGPLVDRYLAAQAGIGIYGKNNCLIIPGAGSYVVLGYLIINKQVSHSVATPQPRHSCDGCGRCQRACPAKALEEPYQVSPGLCLSHLLQQKENIPNHLRKCMGQQIYGCDICQEVCPHNIDPSKIEEPMMLEEPRLPWIDTAKLLTLSNRQFNRLYRNRAFGWRGQKIMQRNALLALGNSNDTGAIQHIKPFLDHQRESLKDMAQWALSQHT